MYIMQCNVMLCTVMLCKYIDTMDMGWHDKWRYNTIFDVGPHTSNTRILNILTNWYTIGRLRISFHLNHTASLPFGDNDAPQWTTGFCRPRDVPCEENLANFNRTNNNWRFHGPPPMKKNHQPELDFSVAWGLNEDFCLGWGS